VPLDAAAAAAETSFLWTTIFHWRSFIYIGALIGSKHMHHFYRASACYACRAPYCFTNSVRLSLSNVGVASKRMHMSHFLTLYWYHSSFFRAPTAVIKFHESLSGALNTRGGKILRFSTEIAVCLGNSTRQAHDYYGSLNAVGIRVQVNRHPIFWVSSSIVYLRRTCQVCHREGSEYSRTHN